jgi:hypothetical protein
VIIPARRRAKFDPAGPVSFAHYGKSLYLVGSTTSTRDQPGHARIVEREGGTIAAERYCRWSRAERLRRVVDDIHRTSRGGLRPWSYGNREFCRSTPPNDPATMPIAS